MAGLTIKYEWLSHDHICLKSEFHDRYGGYIPMVFECSRLVINYVAPEGASKYGTYVGEVGGKEFVFAMFSLDDMTKDDADNDIKAFFLSRPSE